MTGDPYKTLGVAKSASASEIKRAYRKLARTYHPDVNDSPDAETRFRAINAAYDLLKDHEARAAYDTGETPTGHGRAASDGGSWPGGFDFSRHPGGQGAPFAEIFETFGRTGGFSGASGAFAADQHVRIQIPLEDAFRGAVREIHLQQPRIDSQGQVVLEDRLISVAVPAGILPGQLLRLSGKGLTAQEGAPPGDLIVEVAFAPHPTYRIDGKDLHLDLPLAPWEAALGTKLAVPTPGGNVTLTVPQNARSGQKLRLKGRGLPANPPGHIYVTLRIVNPDASSAEAQKMFRHMESAFDFDPRAAHFRA